jgi:hypothetical protein
MEMSEAWPASGGWEKDARCARHALESSGASTCICVRKPTGYGSAQALSTGLGTTGVGLVVPAFLVGSSTPRRDRRAWWQFAKLSGQGAHTSGYLQGRVSFEA